MAQTRLLSTALVALSLGLAPMAVFAQDTTTAPASEAPQAPATEAPAAPQNDAPAAAATTGTAQDGLSLGQSNEGQVGSTYTKAVIEQWEQRCMKTELTDDPCQLYQLLKDGQGNSVAELTLFNLPKSTDGPAVAGATFVAPLDTFLPAGVEFQIDSGKSKTYPFTFCNPMGCVSRIGFLAEEIAAMKKGAKATITIIPAQAPDQKVALELSFKGFTASYDELLKLNDAADNAIAEAVKKAQAAAPAEGAAAPAEGNN